MATVLTALMLAAAAAMIAGIRAIVPAERRPPPAREIAVAVVLTEGATMIDFAGPWEVFQDVQRLDGAPAFRLYTVGASREPIQTSGGMTVVPDYTFADAPTPKIIVIGAQRGGPELNAWLQKRRGDADVIMSVCTGAFHLGAAGLLDGKPATTHHDFYDRFAARFPAVKVRRDQRFVRSDPVVYTAGGLTSGIDLALHIVQEYFGRQTAEQTAAYMEYQGVGWRDVPAKTGY
jgi:transcriptional regulator GlxA family with amidase domain